MIRPIHWAFTIIFKKYPPNVFFENRDGRDLHFAYLFRPISIFKYE